MYLSVSYSFAIITRFGNSVNDGIATFQLFRIFWEVLIKKAVYSLPVRNYQECYIPAEFNGIFVVLIFNKIFEIFYERVLLNINTYIFYFPKIFYQFNQALVIFFNQVRCCVNLSCCYFQKVFNCIAIICCVICCSTSAWHPTQTCLNSYRAFIRVNYIPVKKIPVKVTTSWNMNI